MKRFFPRALPEAVALSSLLGLFALAGTSCAPDQGVQPGAPVLSTLSLIEPSGNRVDITADTKACTGFVATVPDGGSDAATGDAQASAGDAGVGDAGASEAGAPEAGASDASPSEAGSPPAATAVKEGDDCDPATDGVCTSDGVLCNCVAKDMCDPTIDGANPTTKGTLNCTYAPMSKVLAVFDRLLDTAPFTDGNGDPTGAPTAKVIADPLPGTVFTIVGTYNSSGSAKTIFAPLFGANLGPAVTMNGAPGFPTVSKITATLDGTVVMAKDGKTPFAGMGGLADGKVSFKTTAFSLDSITVPQPPAPMDTGSSGGGDMMMGCPMAMMPADGGFDAAADDAATTTDGGNADGGTGDAATIGLDASALDAGASDVVASDASPLDAVASDAGATDASAADDAAPTPTDVQVDMNKGAITIAFNNPVGKDVKTHIKVTEDGQPFADFDITSDDEFPTATVTITPTKDKSMPPDPTKDHTWAAGKTYTVTVDASAADVFGAKTGAEQTMSFTMSKN